MAVNKLTQEELQQLQQIQNNQRAVVQEFGQIALAQLDLDKRQENAETFLNNLRNSESELAKALEEKYGPGNINLESGEIVTQEPIATGTDSVDLPEIQKEETKKPAKADKK